MAAEAIKIRANGAKLFKETGDERIAGYKTMPLDDLRTLIESIGKGGSAAPAKGKAAPAANGAQRQKGKATSTAAPVKGKATTTATPAKGKGKSSASTSVPAKSKTRQSPAKGKGSTGTAKRPTAAAAKGKGSTPAKGKSTTPAKGRTTPAKSASTRKAATTPAKARGKRAPEGAARIDNKAVDWKAEWGGGKIGKRAEVMDALRKTKGDKAKVFTALQGRARTFYKGRTKHEAERMLVWLIGRVAFDFVTATGQHEMGTRDAHGASENPINVRRRARREEQHKAAEKAARAAKRASAASGKGKTPARGKAATGKGKGRS